MKKEVLRIHIEERILKIRGHRVMIDRDLAQLYKVSTKAFNQAIKRNRSRFPDDFMFRLTRKERNELVTNCDRFKTMKHATSMPYAFTDYGALMAANVLNSEQAIKVSIFVVRTFIKLRELMNSHRELALKLAELERKTDKHDSAIQTIFEAIRRIMAVEEKPKRRIGFQT